MSFDEPVKLLFGGPVGAGKTTAIRSLSDTAPISTDVPLTDFEDAAKPTTTVAFDYSSIRLDDDTTLHLYGLPGQGRLDFMREIVAEGALGAIILVDATSPSMAADCREWIRSLRTINAGLKFAVGVSKTDLARDFSLADVREAIRSAGAGNVPAMTIDPRDGRQSGQLVRALLMSF